MASKSSTIDDKPLLKQWLWPLQTAFWVLAVAIGVWVYTIVASTWWARERAPDEPTAYQVRALNQDLEALAQLEPQLFVPAELARWIGDTLHDGLVTGFIKVARTFMNPPTAKSRSHFSETSAVKTSKDPGGDYVRQATADAGADWNNVVVGTYIFAARTAWFAAGLPLLLLALSLGLVDGLVARAKRRSEAGRESAGLYHRAKLMLTFSLILGYLIALGLPVLPSPLHLLIPLSLGCGGLLRIQAAFYKKYL